ncbi:MAG TPA: ABC transporter permease [Thermoleophilaceae bacterium]|jgi:ABC-type branched-subunit amino acid transport system permease subunit
MDSYILFLLLGLGAGAVYALLGLGLVLKYRSSGVVDFGHAAVAMFCAYVYIELRSNGKLEFPWVLIPHEVSVASANGTSQFIAIVFSLAYGAVLGLAFYALLYRPLRQAPALARVAASVGVMIYLQAIAVINFGTFALSSPPILPSSPVNISGIPVPSDRLYLAGITVAIAVILAAIYRYTRFGLATSAVSENERGASLIGYSPNRISAYNWVIATLLAVAAGILILPITTLNPGTYTLFIVPALGVALIGRFSSFTVTVIAGLLLGMFQSELTKLQAVWSWLPRNGLQDGVPFVLIMIGMTVLAKRLPSRGATGVLRNASIGRPQRPWTTAGITFVICAIALVIASSLYRTAIISSMITACICMSVVVITGYVGQISLAQSALSGVSAFMLSHIAHSLGIGFPFGLILAALCAVVVGVVIGIPAVRVRGVNLAVVTLATAAALDALVFNADWFSGGYVGRDVKNPHLLGLDLGISKTGNTLVFGITVLVIVLLVGVFVARLRNSPAGRMFIAVRSNENAAASVGVNVARTKLFAFAVSAFVAGIGGGLLAYQQANINAESFTVFTSLTILAITYVGGVARILGAVLAGLLLASNGLVPTLLDKLFDFGTYQAVVAGLAMMLTAVANPDGIATEMQRGFKQLTGKIGGALGIGQPAVAAAGTAEAGQAGTPEGSREPART